MGRSGRASGDIQKAEKVAEVGFQCAPGVRQPREQGSEARPLELEAVQVSEKVAETQEFREHRGRRAGDDRWLDVRKIQTHVLEKLAMPGLTNRDAAVQLRRDPFEDVLGPV
jgi:hypothetical protein